MTDFHCIRKNQNVRVPNSKVCGFRTSNHMTKKGWSSGLKTNSDNNCGHRLSRFSTDQEADCATEKCNGNTNWLNYEGVTFNKTRVNEPWALERGAFRAGSNYIQKTTPQLPVNNRIGNGNYNLSRPAFLAPDILPRDPLDFEKISALNLAQFGAKVQLSEKTLNDLLGVVIPDPSDRSWLDEKNRRIRLGETEEQLERNPPLGRPQRTIKKRINFGEAKLGLQASINAIKTAVDAGRAETIEQKRLLGLEIARVFSSTENIRKLTGRNMSELKQAIDRLKVPNSYLANGFKHRIFSFREFVEQQGLITLFLLSDLNIPDLNTPIKVEARGGFIYVSLSNMINAMMLEGDNTWYLDLGQKALIRKVTAEQLVLLGVDDGLLDGSPVKPSATPTGEPSGTPTGEPEEKKESSPPIIVSPGEFGSLEYDPRLTIPEGEPPSLYDPSSAPPSYLPLPDPSATTYYVPPSATPIISFGKTEKKKRGRKPKVKSDPVVSPSSTPTISFGSKKRVVKESVGELIERELAELGI